MSAVCEIDLDCPNTTVCFVNVSWLLEDGIESACLCGNWNAYLGDECNELGPGAYYYAASGIVTLVMTLFGLFLSLYSFRKMIIGYGGIKLNATTVTNLGSTLAFLCISCWRIIIIFKALTPEKLTLVVTENLNEGRKTHSTRRVEFAFLFLSVLFTYITTLNLSLNWVELTRKVGSFSQSGEILARRYKILIIVIEIVYVVVASVIWQISSALFFITGVPLLFFILIVYNYGSCRMMGLLRSMILTEDKSYSRYSSLAKRIRASTRLITLGILITLIGGGAYSYLSLIPEGGWRGVSPTGQVSPVMATNELIPLGTVVVALGVQYFLYTTSYGLTKSSRGPKSHTGDASTNMDFLSADSSM